MEQIEEWRPVKGYEGLYEISNCGRLKCFAKGVITYGAISEKGYRVTCLYKNKEKKSVFIHRLVAKAFIQNPQNLPFINHKDENKLNNNVENLQWCDRNTNMKNPITRKRLRINSHHRPGEKGRTDRKIARMKDGAILAIYDSISEIKEEGYNDSCVYWACNGKHKTHAGFEWRYIYYDV